jgi:DNA-binding XRE family transcriptional regulator
MHPPSGSEDPLNVVEFPATPVDVTDPRFDPKLSPGMCRAGRAFLDWTLKDLAEKSGVSIVPIHRFETGQSSPMLETVLKIKAAMEAEGIEFGEEAVAYRPKKRRR